MRNLFLALVLANLAFAAWHAWFAPARRTTPAPVREAPSLTLVSELPAEAVEQVTAREALAPAPESTVVDGVGGAAESVAAAPRRDEPVAAEPAAAAQSRCVSVGPFRELAQAASAAASLRTAGYAPVQRVAEGDVWIGYWVYIQAIPTQAEAEAILERVRAAGISDSYVRSSGDTGNIVSLGVFTEIAGVTRRREQVRALGYEPTVVDSTRRATVYWVDVLLAADQTLDLASLQTPGRILRLEQRACAAPTA